MFENLKNMSQDDLIKRKEEIQEKIDELNSEIKSMEKKLRKGLLWWLIIPLLGYAIYLISLNHRQRVCEDDVAKISVKKMRVSELQLELMKIDTLILK